MTPGVLAVLVLASPRATATSTGGTVHAWDLDGDCAFDDANGPH